MGKICRQSLHPGLATVVKLQGTGRGRRRPLEVRKCLGHPEWLAQRQSLGLVEKSREIVVSVLYQCRVSLFE